MKPFSAKPQCEKCGSRDVHREYHHADQSIVQCGSYGSGLPSVTKEHHILYCRGCSYSWQERVKK